MDREDLKKEIKQILRDRGEVLVDRVSLISSFEANKLLMSTAIETFESVQDTIKNGNREQLELLNLALDLIVKEMINKLIEYTITTDKWIEEMEK